MFNIIPEPKQVDVHSGLFSISDPLRITAPLSMKKHILVLVELVQEKYQVRLQPRFGEEIQMITMAKVQSDAQDVIVPLHLDTDESYRIEVAQEQITVRGTDAAGLFYGLQTLIQIIEDYRDIPCCRMTDWPDMKIRGVHFDLKGGVPTKSYLSSLISELGRFKINTILVEYEDKFKFESHPLISRRSALSRQDVLHLQEVAKDHHIQIMPLLQSLGHAEYILRHEQYANLRETNDYYQQMCPSNPDSFKLFTELFHELADLHKDSVYFHIGGDETHQLGECPVCSEKSKASSKYAMYAQYMKKVCNYVIDADRIPVIWDDMFTRHAPELISEMPKKTVFMYWNYRFTHESMSTVQSFSGNVISEQWLHKSVQYLPDRVDAASALYEQLPQEEKDFIEKYGNSTDFPAQINSTIFLEFLQDQGYDVMGASAAQMMRDTILSDPERAIPNIQEWAKAVKRHQSVGVISTGWTRNNGMDPLNGLIEGMRYAFIASGEYYWSSEGVTTEVFDRKFCKRFYDLEESFQAPADLMTTDAIWLIRHQERVPVGMPLSGLLEQMAGAARRNQHNLMYYGFMSKVFQIQKKVDDLMASMEIWFYMRDRQLLQERVALMARKHIDAIEMFILQVEEEGHEILRPLIHPEELDDCLHCLFFWHKTRIRIMKDLVSSMALH